MTEEINSILSFWFGNSGDQNTIIQTQSELWWGKSKQSDDIIKQRFGGIYQSAVNDELNAWLQSAQGQLALILLLDQFSRVIHRDTPAAFSQDVKASAITIEGVGKNIDKSLSPLERVFYYMPLEHAEDLEKQNQSVNLFGQLLLEAPEDLKEKFQNYLDFANQHRLIIERFGRFPHRNKLLKRFSNAEEIAFLSEPGSSF